MNGFPPPILVETWIYLATSHKPELAHVKMPTHSAIKEYFGSIELAYLYIEEKRDKDIEVHFV